jgi:hypothetical protein
VSNDSYAINASSKLMSGVSSVTPSLMDSGKSQQVHLFVSSTFAPETSLLHAKRGSFSRRKNSSIEGNHKNVYDVIDKCKQIK